MLYDSPFNIGEEDLAPLGQCNFWVKTIMGRMTEIELSLQNSKDTLNNQLREIRKNFGEELNSIELAINHMRDASEKSLYKTYVEAISVLKQRLEEADEKMKEINTKEELLGWTPMEFTKLEEAQRNIKPYDEL